MTFLRGRMNRATYWLGLSVLVLLYAVLNFVSSKPVPVSEVVIVFLCVPRLHDLGLSGWFVLAPIGLEIAAIVLGLALLPMDQVMVLLGAVTVLIGLGLLVLGALPGEPQANRFGDVPARGLQFKKTQDRKVAETFD